MSRPNLIRVRVSDEERQALEKKAAKENTTLSNIVRSVAKQGATMEEIGDTGLKQFSGVVREEFLRQLTGDLGKRVYREMRENDATIGAIFHAMLTRIRSVEWFVEPAEDEPNAKEHAEFLESVKDDTSHSWEDFISEISDAELTFGHAPFEIVWKRRTGRQRRAGLSSRFQDGRIGVRKFAIRSPESIIRWHFDEDGGIQGLQQQLQMGGTVDVPIEKLLLFRTEVRKGNPEGRALDPTTLIPTPDGWKLLDELGVGSKVFDEAGKIRYVTNRADWENRPCYEIEFSDGVTVVADANHVWVTHAAKERHRHLRGRTRTTQELFETVSTRRGRNEIKNHSIEPAAPLDYPEQVLPLDPYYLGLWLGDGYSRTSTLATHEQDAEEVAASINEIGYTTRIRHNGPANSRGRSIHVYGERKRDASGPQFWLRALGLRENKHVPDAYMRSSESQRRALLAGLMDSDGHVDRWGRCEFVNTNRGLVDAVVELVRSLGLPAKVALRRRANGVDHKLDAWAVRFRPPWSPFRLSRKSERVRPVQHRYGRHYIAAIRPVAPRRTVCLEVDSPSHMFLVGENMVPTHNSILRSCYRAWFIKKKIEEIEGIGIERDMAGVPKAFVPADWLLSGSAHSSQLDYIKKVVRNLRNDEQAGLVLPTIIDEQGNRVLDVTLMSSPGTRVFDTTKVIDRWDKRIAMTVLADFLFLGQSGDKGSWALASAKTKMFAVAFQAILDGIQSVLNRHLVPRLFALNGIQAERFPEFRHGDVESIELQDLAEFFSALATAGAGFFPSADGELERWLLEQVGAPIPPPDVDFAPVTPEPKPPSGQGGEEEEEEDETEDAEEEE